MWGKISATLGLLLGLVACAPAPPPDPPTRTRAVQITLPAMKTFVQPRPTAPTQSNADIARDFLDLSFALESGRSLPVFTRFEGAITVHVAGAPPASLQPDLTRLLARLRREARIDITEVDDVSSARIVIEAIPQARLQAVLPEAACFLVPNVTSLSEYRQFWRNPQFNWATLEERRQVAIFVPNDVSPQEVRDCLHEELAQALGPLNDLYRLPQSIFNDDNIHAVLTGFDMLILRATYDPALQSGMTQEQVAARLPAILARLNSAGQQRPSKALPETPRAWTRAIQTALSPRTSPAARTRAARRAILIAEDLDWRDHRLGFAYYTVGRILQETDQEGARSMFEAAWAVFSEADGTDLHQAFVAAQLAGVALDAGDTARVFAILDRAQPVAARHEHAALLASLLALRAQALALDGRTTEAQTVRMDSVGWARYGFGSDWIVRAKLQSLANASTP